MTITQEFAITLQELPAPVSSQGPGQFVPPPAGSELPAALRVELLDPAVWKPALEKYAAAMRLAVALTDVEGQLLGPCVNPQPTWSLFHRQQATGVANCPFGLAGGPPCTCIADAWLQGTVVVASDRTGLVHVAVPLTLGEHRLGTLLAGQVFDRYPEQLPLEKAARRCGLAPDKVAQMARREHPLRRDTLRVYADLLAAFGEAFLQSRYHGLMEARRLAEMKRLQEQVFQAQKMETVGRLAGGVAHDFNNLMTPVLGYCDILLRDLAPDDPICPGLRVIRDCAQRAATVTRQLLGYGRKQVLKPRVLDLNAVVTEMEPILDRLLRADVEQVRDLDRALGRVKADPGQLGQVLMNLVVNACDAMPGGGCLTIATRNEDLSAAEAEKFSGEVRPGAYVVLAVSDTGCGMDEDTRAHLFEPFFTTKGVGKGTGLGLACSYGVVAQSGGHIAVRSAPGQGSTFTVYLPRLETSMPLPPRPLAAPPPAIIQGTETVLLVDDAAEVRNLVRLVLQRCGYTVLEAGNGQEALQIQERYRGTIHLLVTDVLMPHLGGPALAKRLSAVRPALKVLYISGHPNDTSLAETVGGAGAGFLLKPFTLDALASKVRGLLDT